ncbi:MAG TPA: hypothetical protein VF553_17145 [Pyrinomonadaceae bacterium]|jgi:tetratricopeptide (TPR) repeat protein
MTQHLIDDELAEQDLLACATRVAETIDNVEGHGEAMAGAAARYADAGQFDFAVALAETIGDPYIRDRTLSDIAVKSFEAGEGDDAMRLLETIEDPGWQEESAAQISLKRAAAGHYRQAAELARQMQDASSTLAEIAVKWAEASHYDEALELVRDIESQGSAASALAEIASIYTKAGQRGEAAELLSQATMRARSVELTEDRVSILVSIGVKYAEAGEPEKAEEVLAEASRLAESVEIERYRENSLAQVSFGFARLGQGERALETAALIDDSFQAAMAHANLASEHLRAGRREEGLAMLSRALELAEAEEYYQENTYPMSKYRALSAIAVQYAEADLYRQATQTAKLIESEQDRSAALIEVERALMRVGNIDQALNAARMIEDQSLGVIALTTLAQSLIKDGQQERALNILAEARRIAVAIPWPNDKTLAFAEIARKYAATEQAEETAQLLLHALETSAGIESRYSLALALAQLSDVYDETGAEIDEHAMNILREIVIKLD